MERAEVPTTQHPTSHTPVLLVDIMALDVTKSMHAFISLGVDTHTPHHTKQTHAHPDPITLHPCAYLPIYT